MTSDPTIRVGNAAVPTTETGPLFASKFAVPETPPFNVDRARLFDRLSEAVRNPVTVVTGPPGSGKTRLAASWVAAGCAPGTTVWITLEEGDDNPAVFWPYLIEGLRRSGIALSGTIDEAARRLPFDRSSLARLAVDLATQQTPVVLVLDNASVLTDRQHAEDLEALLRHADQHLRMMLVGRSDPPLPLYRYRLAGTLSEVRGDALAFTVSEAATLLAAHCVELPDCAVRSLVERTEGWAVGLRLFAMAMQGRTDAGDLVVTIAGDDANIAEYFLGEVLAAQPPEIRDFLLRTSIVDDFTPDLAEALLERGDARRALAALKRANVFVQPVAERSTVHRYHRLFAELLRAQLAYEDPDQARRLHRRAAAWFVAHGRTAEATRHAVNAEDWEYASALTIRDLGIGRLVAGGQTDRLGKLFHRMPADVGGPDAALVMAAQSLAVADPDEAAKHTDRATGLVDSGPPAERTLPLRLTIAVLDAATAAMQHDARALHACEVAETLMTQALPDHVDARPELRTIVLFAKGVSQSQAGALGDAIASLTDGVAAAPHAGRASLRIACLEQLALANAYLGRLREAADAANQAVQLVRHRHGESPHDSLVASVVLAWVATERWSATTAWRHLHAAETDLRSCNDALTIAAFALVRSRLLSGRGELRAASRILTEVETPEGHDPPLWLAREIMLSKARLAAAMGRPDEALATVETLSDQMSGEAVIVSAAALVARGEAEQGNGLVAPVVEAVDLPTPQLIEAWLVRAVAANECGQADVVRDALGQALALAAPDGHRRVFHEAGPRLRQLLRNDQALAARYQALGCQTALKSAAPPASGSLFTDAPILVDALSERELQVLKHLAAMLGTEEIADAMYLSVNTVKTHVRNILRKLAASRRNEAVRRARALGIV